jgi:hypothetical protein
MLQTTAANSHFESRNVNEFVPRKGHAEGRVHFEIERNIAGSIVLSGFLMSQNGQPSCRRFG